MTKIAKLWTGVVAYVSLAVGAGLSMAGNLADTYRTRGTATDTLDKVLAIGWPALVILAIEMFVSPKWKQTAMFQAWRWIGCLGIGGMAMVASWTHLHDLMANRGQLAVVAILGPLAIDGMAIMATGLILSTRGQVATGRSFGQKVADVLDTLATGQHFGQEASLTGQHSPGGQLASEMDMDVQCDYEPGQIDTASGTMLGLGHGQGLSSAGVQWPMPPNAGRHWPLVQRDPLASGHNPTRPDGDYQAWVDGYEQAIAEAGAEEVERWLAEGAPEPAVPVVPGPEELPKRPRGTKIPDEARREIEQWNGAATALDQWIADQFSVSTRTARRWRQAVLGQSSAIPAASGEEESDGEEEVPDL